MQAQRIEQTSTPDGEVLSQHLSRAELAAQLKVTPNTLARWRWERKGPKCFQVGRKVYYDRADVQAWLESLKQDGAR